LITAFAEFPIVVEVRHASWQQPDVLRHLADRGVGFVNIDQPHFREATPPPADPLGPTGFLRVHGRNYNDWWRHADRSHDRYDYLYTSSELRIWAERATQIPSAEVYIVTNNHYRGKAVANALM